MTENMGSTSRKSLISFSQVQRSLGRYAQNSGAINNFS